MSDLLCMEAGPIKALEGTPEPGFSELVLVKQRKRGTL